MNFIIKPISVILKEARKGKGLSLEEAYKATKVHPNILHALEEGTTLGLGRVYVKSYIKIYANYLGISQQELDKYFHPIVPKEKKVHLDIPFRVKGEKIKDWSRRLNIFSNLRFKIKRSKKLKVIFIILLAFMVVSLSRCFHQKGLLSFKSVTKDSSSASSRRATDTKLKSDEAKEGFPTEIGEFLRLTIFAEEDIWMQIKVDGEIAFKRILKKSNSETWQAKDSLNLWLANAGIVKLELNGKILPPIGRRGQLLKDVVITREGITINK